MLLKSNVPILTATMARNNNVRKVSDEIRNTKKYKRRFRRIMKRIDRLSSHNYSHTMFWPWSHSDCNVKIAEGLRNLDFYVDDENGTLYISWKDPLEVN